MTEHRQITSGQPVTDLKRERSRQLRRAMTPAERRLWECLRGRRLAGLHFRRQQVIGGFIADFFCARAGVVVELDGPVHEAQAEYDAHRDRVLADCRLTILRYPNERVMCELSGVLDDIRARCGT